MIRKNGPGIVSVPSLDGNEFLSCISYNSFLFTSFILSHHMVVTYFLPWEGFCSGMESYRLPPSLSVSELKYFSFVRGNRGRRVSVLNGHFGVCSRSLLNARQTGEFVRCCLVNLPYLLPAMVFEFSRTVFKLRSRYTLTIHRRIHKNCCLITSLGGFIVCLK